jgi:hypothetical protein
VTPAPNASVQAGSFEAGGSAVRRAERPYWEEGDLRKQPEAITQQELIRSRRGGQASVAVEALLQRHR